MKYFFIVIISDVNHIICHECFCFFSRWFCGMDVSFARNMLLAGDNKGTGYKFSLDGKLENQWRLHKNKIHHIEFSKK